MTIDKALELLPEAERYLGSHGFLNHADAIQLGMQALESVKNQYDPDHQMMRHPLPGETK